MSGESSTKPETRVTRGLLDFTRTRLDNRPDLGGARTELERNRSALAIFTERERECAQFKKTRA